MYEKDIEETRRRTKELINKKIGKRYGFEPNHRWENCDWTPHPAFGKNSYSHSSMETIMRDFGMDTGNVVRRMIPIDATHGNP